MGYWEIERDIIEEFNKNSKDRLFLYNLADKSRVMKEPACRALMALRDVGNEDLLKVVQRSSRYRQAAAYKLCWNNKKGCTLTDNQLKMMVDKNAEKEWVKRELEKRGIIYNGQIYV